MGEVEKTKLRTKDLREDFEEMKSSEDLDISLTISKSSSSASQVPEPATAEIVDTEKEVTAVAEIENKIEEKKAEEDI